MLITVECLDVLRTENILKFFFFIANCNTGKTITPFSVCSLWLALALPISCDHRPRKVVHLGHSSKLSLALENFLIDPANQQRIFGTVYEDLNTQFCIRARQMPDSLAPMTIEMLLVVDRWSLMQLMMDLPMHDIR